AFHFLLLLPVIVSALILTVVALTTRAPPFLPLAILPSVLISVPIWLLFSVLRATVTTSHVHIQYGLLGPKIPLENIQSCEAVSYDWMQYGGFGVRKGLDGTWAYNMMGDQGRAVKLCWTNDRGKVVNTLVSASDPDAFVAAVAEAKGRAKLAA